MCKDKQSALLQTLGTPGEINRWTVQLSHDARASEGRTRKHCTADCALSATGTPLVLLALESPTRFCSLFVSDFPKQGMDSRPLPVETVSFTDR